MSAARTEVTELTTDGESAGEAAAAAAGAAVARARQAIVQVVGDYPRASLVGAVALGFLLARLVRKASEDWS
jgi:hypothetical protein